jgi:hypothetical protein
MFNTNRLKWLVQPFDGSKDCNTVVWHNALENDMVVVRLYSSCSHCIKSSNQNVLASLR